jgi:predicted anti-sigma-YlaC factor YlaD
MPDHVTEWLNAYLDSELKNGRLQMVEAHLAQCEACQAELEALRDVSRLLHKIPKPEFIPVERFTTQVNLLLPNRPVAAAGSKLFELGWWMIPVGLLAAWIFISTAVLVSNMVSTANSFGFLDNTTASWVSGSSESVSWTSALGRLGLMENNGLQQWFEITEGYSRNFLPQFIWQIAIALLYLTWIAIWWARQTRQARQTYGQALEG